MIPPRDFGDLVQLSDAVVVARAAGSSGFFRGNMISTGTSFTIIDVVKGDLRVGQRLNVEAPGGVAGQMGFAVGGRPEFEEGEVYLLTLNQSRGVWMPLMLAYGQLVERRSPTGQRLFTHIEQVHDLELVHLQGRSVEEIGSYRSSDLVPHLKAVAAGRTWDKETAGLIGELPFMAHSPSKIAELAAAPLGCDFMSQGGQKIRWDRFEAAQSVAFFTPTAASAPNKALVGNAVNEWKSIAGINVSTLVHTGDKVEPPCEDGDAFNQLYDNDLIGIGESFVFFNDPCSQINDLVNCSGVLAIAGPLFSLAVTHEHRGETWITALKGGMVVNNNLLACINQTELEQTVTHEMGHIIGFGHHTGAAAIMNASCCNPITTLDELCALYAYSDVTINEVPVIASISPDNGGQGETVAVQILGANFLPASTVSISGAGVTISNSTYVNANRIDIELDIDGAAATTARNIRVTSPGPGGGQSNAAIFTVTPPPNPAPVLASLSPNEGDQGEVVVVTLTGSDFVATSTVSVDGAGVTVSNVNFVNSTTLTAIFTLAGAASVGPRAVTVTNPTPGGGVSGSVNFTVNQAPNPVPFVSGVTPESGFAGTSVGVSISGSSFVAGSTVQVSGAGVTVSSVTLQNPTTITATLTIAGGASLGARDLTVTNPAPGGGVSDPVQFTVVPPPNPIPVLTAVTPNSGVTGATLLVTLTGSSFVSGATVQVSGPGVTVSSVSVQNSNTISAMFTLAADAPAGLRQVTVTSPAPGGGQSQPVAFTVGQLFVNKSPTLNGIENVSFFHTAGEQTIPLTGIGAGEGENQNLSITATSSNPLLIPDLDVDYISPQGTGNIRLRNDPTMTGAATVRVLVKDDGGIANGGVDSLVRVFTVNVLLDTDLGDEGNAETPASYRLDANYPNPFNPTTVIPFSLPTASPVRIAVYDVNGRLRSVLLDREMGAGRHEVAFDASGLSSGMYLVRMSGPLGIQSIRIMLVK